MMQRRIRGNQLSDLEWLQISHAILAVNQAETHENVRYQALGRIMDVVPFQCASFFLVNGDELDPEGCLIVQPTGIDIPIALFEKRIAQALSLSSGAAERKHVSTSLLGPFDDNGWPVDIRDIACGHYLVCKLSDDAGAIGVIVLARTQVQGAFSERDALVLDAMGEHLAFRLRTIARRGSPTSLHTTLLKEDYALTRRELEVMAGIAYGMTIPDIATKLAISKGTVRKHLENIYRKVGVNNRMSLMKLAQQYMVASQEAADPGTRAAEAPIWIS